MKTGLLVITLLILLVSCLPHESAMPKRVTIPPPGIDALESVVRIKIPPTAFDVQWDIESGGMDDLAAVSFVLPASDLDDFLKQAGYSGPLEPITALNLGQFDDLGLEKKIPGWPTPAQWDTLVAAKVLKGRSQTEPDFVRKIIVDCSADNLCTIYLIHFEV